MISILKGLMPIPYTMLLSENKTLWIMGSNADKQLAFEKDAPEQLGL
ncbi:hypothetical protein RVIR1_07250 [Candidatus Rickettsiella viridis]|uniref:Uncharacterized protein n=1 Tax=Candidatus Rickettsiella viridis TaxID=676208 RepID=A0A2Z5UUQ5_9COXI|nr:hypothetical protein RVIR1_07250 [Candidatus Rickettsiella viridis]